MDFEMIGSVMLIVAGLSIPSPLMSQEKSNPQASHRDSNFTAPEQGPGESATGGLRSVPQNPSLTAKEPAVGETMRVGGDADAKIERADAGWFRCGACLIDTPLPVGYPMPTPPGAIDIKRYPTVRRAEVGGSMTPDIGMNLAFWPLFNHIKSRDIAMTSPVEMDYRGVDMSPPEGGDIAPESWTMSFLYRTPDQGPAGKDDQRKQVTVVDSEPVTVISLGMKGGYSFVRVAKGLKQLESWLAAQTEWDAAGSPRALYYNGPDRRGGDKWSEVQIPVKRRAVEQKGPGKPAAASGAQPEAGK